VEIIKQSLYQRSIGRMRSSRPWTKTETDMLEDAVSKYGKVTPTEMALWLTETN
jgi:hypothetical protein